MEEWLPIEEIEKRYPMQWLVLEHVKSDNMQHVLGGVVVYHGEKDDGFFEALGNAKGERASRYTGPVRWKSRIDDDEPGL